MRIVSTIAVIMVLCLPLMGMTCPRNNVTPVDTGNSGLEVRMIEEEGPDEEMMQSFEMKDPIHQVWLPAKKVPGGWELTEVGKRQEQAIDGCNAKCKKQFPGTSPSCTKKFQNCLQDCVSRK